MSANAARGDEIIRIHVAELRQLLNSMDPTPFPERDIDPEAEAFIVDWAADAPRHAQLALAIHVDRPPADPGEADALRASLTKFFAARGKSTRLALRRLLKRGRISLIVGTAFLSASLVASELLERWLHPSGFLGVLRESLLIGGWVAMWRPLEILLYDWWPLRAKFQLFDRLRDMPVRIEYSPVTLGQ